MKKILLVIAMLLSGCDSQRIWAYAEYVSDPYRQFLVLPAHVEFCNDNEDSMFCEDSQSYGDIQPTRAYILNLIAEHRRTFKYVSDGKSDHWKYNDTIHESLRGDCEDKALTMIHHMVTQDGIDKKYLVLVYRLISETEAHMFVAVNTSDAGWLHVDYVNSGQPLEENINWHMLMSDVGTLSWIKGNIK